MITAAPAPRSPLRGRQLQGGLALAGLLAAVIGTVVLVAAPASSTSPTTPPSATAIDSLPFGLRVEVRGGDPLVAHGLADRLAGAGASLGSVRPVADDSATAFSTMIVYYDRAHLAAATRIRSMLGRGTLRRQQVFQPPVDVTIVVGKDLSRP